MTKQSFFAKLFTDFLNLLYPPRCVNCQAENHSLCPACIAQIPALTEPLCRTCGYPLPQADSICAQCQKHPLYHLTAIRSAAFFDNQPLRKAIHQFKYKNKQLLKDEFAPLLANCYHAYHLKTEIIVPVPLHKKRYRERGYNQSQLLAQGLSTLINQPVDTKTLVRNQATETQTKLNLQERRQNVADAFSCTQSALQGRVVLLIDDVCTTGATLDACAKTLRYHNTGPVYALTLARAR